MPKGTIGTRASAQARTMAATSSVDSGKTTASGFAGGVPRLGVAVVLADRVGRGDAVAEEVAKPLQQQVHANILAWGGVRS